MKKMFAVGATAALMLAASSPAFAQGADVGNAFADNDSTAIGGDTSVRFVDASQFQFAAQGQFGDANANAFDGSEATAVVTSDQGITQNQVNGGFNNGFNNDLDDDGIFDEFDWIVLVGDFDNDGIVDDFDLDGIGDVFDEDDDNDGVFDVFE